MSQFLICDKCKRHVIRGVETCNCGNNLKGYKNIALVGRVDNSKSENMKQAVKMQFKDE